MRKVDVMSCVLSYMIYNYRTMGMRRMDMTQEQLSRRIAAVKTADAINAIEGFLSPTMPRHCPIAGSEEN